MAPPSPSVPYQPTAALRLTMTPGLATAYGPPPAGRRTPTAVAPAAPNATPSATPAVAAAPVSPATLHALLDALRSERKLLDDLAATMRRQRAAVGAEDLEAVDDSVFATHRILATLGQARLRRRAVNRLVVGVETLPVRALDEVLGGQMTDELREARDGLQGSAESLGREVDANRRVLREALAAGDAHARVLTGAAVDGPGAAALAGALARGLIDRTA